MASEDDWMAELDELEQEKKAAKAATITPVIPATPKIRKPIQAAPEKWQFEEADFEGLSTAQRKKLEKVTKDDHSYFDMERLGTNLRSPICCILGHVDTGKTKLLDQIRKTNVQDNEAGGITQQIGATFFPQDKLIEMCKVVSAKTEVKLPGLLIIDTPGHESFNNLRSRGASMCDIAILVVDIMHGLEPQTRESIGILKSRKVPFVIALNKIDRLYGWKSTNWETFKKLKDKQSDNTMAEFYSRWEQISIELSTEGLNTKLWWENKDIKSYISVIPTSAHTGEGIPDLLFMLTGMTQVRMAKALTYKDEVECSLLEVKQVEGHGTTIDVILVNGELFEGDKIVVCGLNGPIVTTIKTLMTPRPMKEIRVKANYLQHKKLRAAMGIKISAMDLEDAVSGTSVFKVMDDEDIPRLSEEVQKDMTNIFTSVDSSGIGVYVQASTLGSLEALLSFLKDSKIPVFAVNIGPITKLDVKKASTMREVGHPELCVMLAFDVKISRDAESEAKKMGVQIFSADIIYHLFDKFIAFRKEQLAEKKEEMKREAVFPVVCNILKGHVYNRGGNDAIICGLRVIDGVLKIETPLIVPEREFKKVGRITSIKHGDKDVTEATKGMEVSVKIEGEKVTVGRDLFEEDELVSQISRSSINCLKTYFKDDMEKDYWKLIIKLKKLLKIL